MTLHKKGNGLRNQKFRWWLNVYEVGTDGATTSTYIAGGIKKTNPNGYREWTVEAGPEDFPPAGPNANGHAWFSVETENLRQAGFRSDAASLQCCTQWGEFNVFGTN